MLGRGRKNISLKTFAIIFLSLGIIIGLILAADMDWLTPGYSDDPGDRPSVQRTAPVAGMPPAGPDFVSVARAATPAVVNISASREIKSRGGTPFFDDPFFRQFFGDEFFRQFQMPRERREQSLGSGVIVHPDGLIITNNHVVAKADRIKILLGDKREFIGKVVGTDPKTDLAVVKIKAKELPTIGWGDSDRLEVGEYVLAIGNPFGLNQTVTMGIVSAVGRANVGIAEYEDFIQTDAAINPGNSGGALVNTRGELIGINTAIFTQSGGYMGVGFAVPSNMAKSVMDNLVKAGKVIRGWLGVSIQDVTPGLAKQFSLPESLGALVSDVLEDSPAERSGLRQGDVIVVFDGKAIESTRVLRNHVAQTAVGKKVKVSIIRDGKPTELEAVIIEMPGQFGRSREGDTGLSDEGDVSTALAGIEVRDLTPELGRRLGLSRSDQGVVITRIGGGNSAMMAGLLEGDLIVEMNRQTVDSVKTYARLAKRIRKQGRVLLLINRQGRFLFVALRP